MERHANIEQETLTYFTGLTALLEQIARFADGGQHITFGSDIRTPMLSEAEVDARLGKALTQLRKKLEEKSNAIIRIPVLLPESIRVHPLARNIMDRASKNSGVRTYHLTDLVHEKRIEINPWSSLINSGIGVVWRVIGGNPELLGPALLGFWFGYALGQAMPPLSLGSIPDVPIAGSNPPSESPPSEEPTLDPIGGFEFGPGPGTGVSGSGPTRTPDQPEEN